MLATVIISIILAAVIAMIIINMVRKKKQGVSSCGCGCSSCALSDECGKNKSPRS